MVIPASVSPSLSALQERLVEIRARIQAPSPGFSATLARAQATTPAPSAATGVASAASAPAPAWATSAAASATAGRTGAVGGEEIVALAKRHLGVPYRWGGTDPQRGLDCSGLVQVVFRDAGIDLPRVSRDQAKAGQPVASLAEARPGDLVAFGSPVDHIGIYAGNGEMVVAPQTGDVVKVQKIGSRTPTAIRRIL